MTPFDEDNMRPQLPSWVPMGVGQSGNQAPQGGGFVSMLKKRLSTPQMKDGKQGVALGKAAVGGGGGSTSGGASL